MEQATTMPAINGASVFRALAESEITGALSITANAVLSHLLLNVHPNDWRKNEPIARVPRVQLARQINTSLKTVQRALVELEQMNLVRRVFNDFHHAIGIDFSPLLEHFRRIRAEADELKAQRRAARAAAKAERAAERAAKADEKILDQTSETSQVDTGGHSNTNPPFEDDSSCTGLGNEVVAKSSSGTYTAKPFVAPTTETMANGAEAVPKFASLRWVLLTVNPRYREIAGDNTDNGKANEATLPDLMCAADVLRQELGFRRSDWERAILQHGEERALAFLVTMASPAAKYFRQIRNPQGYILASFKKPPSEFRPFQSMWAVFQEVQDRQ